MNDNQPLLRTDDVIYVDPEEWDRLMAEMLNPQPLTPAMLRGAELHRRLSRERGQS